MCRPRCGSPTERCRRTRSRRRTSCAAATWYYLFCSIDECCQGTDSTYKITVGRSRNATGPYVDRLGTPLLHGGGTVILSERGPMVGPGGQSISRGWLAHHYYDARAEGAPRLSIRAIDWSPGWPRVSTAAPAPVPAR